MDTLKEYIDFYLLEAKSRLKNSSYISFSGTINNHIAKYLILFNKNIKEITEKDILEYRFILKSCYNESTYYKTILFLKKIFNELYRSSKIDIDVFKNIKMHKILRYKGIHVINLKEFNEMIDFLEKNVKSKNKLYKLKNILLLKLLFRTGLRHAEARALTWESINFTDKILTVKQSIYCTKNDNYEITTPKTKCSYRTIKLDKFILNDLAEYKKIVKYNKYNDFIFATEHGGAYGLGLGKNFLVKAKNSNVPYTSTHGLRHSHATLLLRNGVNPQIVQKRLGHSSIMITINIYSHLTFEDEEKVIEVLEQEQNNILK